MDNTVGIIVFIHLRVPSVNVACVCKERHPVVLLWTPLLVNTIKSMIDRVNQWHWMMVMHESGNLLGYGFLLHIFPFTYIHPFTKFLKYFRILWKSVYNDTTSILELYILLQDSLSQSEATEPSGTVALLSSNSPSEFGNTLFGTCSQCILTATWFLAQGQRPWQPRINSWELSTLTRSHTML